MSVSSRQLRSATRGDPDALHAVVDAWWPKMRLWAMVFCGTPHAAEDAVQEALLRLVKHIGRYDPRRPFGPWLKTLVRNACKDELSRIGRTASWVALETDRAVHPDPGRVLDLQRSAVGAMAAFANLSPRQREILELVDLQGNKPSEVAEQLGLSGSAVRAQLCDARRAIRSQLIAAEILPLLRQA